MAPVKRKLTASEKRHEELKRAGTLCRKLNFDSASGPGTTPPCNQNDSEIKHDGSVIEDSDEDKSKVTQETSIASTAAAISTQTEAQSSFPSQCPTEPAVIVEAFKDTQRVDLV